MSRLKKRQKERILPYSACCSVQTSHGLGEAHPPWGGQSASQATDIIVNLIQISCPTGMPRTVFDQIIWAPCDPVKLPRKIAHRAQLFHSWEGRFSTPP